MLCSAPSLWLIQNSKGDYYSLVLNLVMIRFEAAMTHLFLVDAFYYPVQHKHDTVIPVYNDHKMGYVSAFWSPSRWPRAT